MFPYTLSKISHNVALKYRIAVKSAEPCGMKNDLMKYDHSGCLARDINPLSITCFPLPSAEASFELIDKNCIQLSMKINVFLCSQSLSSEVAKSIVKM